MIAICHAGLYSLNPFNTSDIGVLILSFFKQNTELLKSNLFSFYSSLLLLRKRFSDGHKEDVALPETSGKIW